MADWDQDFLALAEFWARRKSKDPSTKCGAIIVRPNMTVASMGYNGFPQRVPDDPDVYLDRDEKYRRVVHAEMNAILFASESLIGYTLYTWPFLPCERCAVHIIQTGIATVIAPSLPPQLSDRWADSLDLTRALLQQADVQCLEL